MPPIIFLCTRGQAGAAKAENGSVSWCACCAYRRGSTAAVANLPALTERLRRGRTTGCVIRPNYSGVMTWRPADLFRLVAVRTPPPLLMSIPIAIGESVASLLPRGDRRSDIPLHAAASVTTTALSIYGIRNIADWCMPAAVRI